MEFEDHITFVVEMRDAAIRHDPASVTDFYTAMLFVLAWDYTRLSKGDELEHDLKRSIAEVQRCLNLLSLETLH